jgi:hypothetical protein
MLRTGVLHLAGKAALEVRREQDFEVGVEKVDDEIPTRQ